MWVSGKERRFWVHLETIPLLAAILSPRVSVRQGTDPNSRSRTWLGFCDLEREEMNPTQVVTGENAA